jgi:hypothetical protein
MHQYEAIHWLPYLTGVMLQHGLALLLVLAWPTGAGNPCLTLSTWLHVKLTKIEYLVCFICSGAITSDSSSVLRL